MKFGKSESLICSLNFKLFWAEFVKIYLFLAERNIYVVNIIVIVYILYSFCNIYFHFDKKTLERVMNKKIDADFKEMLDEEESVRFDANKFTQLRNSQNLSQSEVAKKVDLSLATINRLEKGHVEPKAKDLVRFAKEFGVSLDWLLDIEVRYPMSMQKNTRTESTSRKQSRIPYLQTRKHVEQLLVDRSTEFLFEDPDTQYAWRNGSVSSATYGINITDSTRNLVCYRTHTDYTFPYIMKNDLVMVDITPINFSLHRKMIVDEGALYTFIDKDTSMSQTSIIHRVLENAVGTDDNGEFSQKKQLILRRLNRLDTPFELISEEEATKKCLGRIVYRAGRMFTEKEKRYLPNF
tara:strand:+ start:2470 stop:3522 length:1053 start_codon:yes stop_codon:yes gene_type:complete